MAMATDAVKTVRQLMVARDVGELVGVVVVTDLGLSKERSSRNVCPFWRIFRPQLHSWRSKLDVEFEAIGLDAADVILVLHLLGCLLLLGKLSPTDVHGPGSIARKRPSSDFAELDSTFLLARRISTFSTGIALDEGLIFGAICAFPDITAVEKDQSGAILLLSAGRKTLRLVMSKLAATNASASNSCSS